MSYLDRPTWSGDVLVGALQSIGAASATGVGLFFVAMIAVEPLVLVAGWLLLLFGFFVGLWVALVALLLFGAPTTLILRKMNAEPVWTYGTLGAASGLAAAALILRDAPFPFWLFVDAAAAGAVGGIVWWRSYRRHFQDSETLSG